MFHMRRATGITLVLMGGGLAAGLATCGGAGAECRDARRHNLPDADRLCSESSRGGSSGAGGSGRSGSTGTYPSGSDRGGFGHASTTHASFGG